MRNKPGIKVKQFFLYLSVINLHWNTIVALYVVYCDGTYICEWVLKQTVSGAVQ